MANYLTYPFKTMRITQNYLGRTSHYPHTTGNIKDYPLDEGGRDGGRDPFYCPCDGMKIVKIYGVYSGGTNTMWVESTTKVNFADGTSDYVCGQLTHMNDSDIGKLKVGQTFKRGDIICYEGTDGATGNHIHHSWGKGHIAEGGWSQNSNGKWVLRTTNGTFKPEQLFYVDKNFTTVDYAGGLTFKSVPTTTKKTSTKTTNTTAKPKYTTGNYKVTTEVLNVRAGAGTNYAIKMYTQFTPDAQTKIKKLAGRAINGYVKDLAFSVLEVKENWGRTPSGWVCLDYCKKI